MAYVPEWERLSVALTRVMSAGVPEDKAKTDICNAIADRKIRVRFLVAKAEECSLFFEMVTVGTVRHGEEVDIPSPLTPGDFNWGLSRPLKPWQRIGGWLRALWGWWHFQWLELSRADVTKVLIASDNGDGISAGSARTAAQESAAIKALHLHLTQLPNPHHLKYDDALKWCWQNGFAISDRGFQARVWPRARILAGLPEKAPPGRKSKVSR
jgi:hypothetical protein